MFSNTVNMSECTEGTEYLRIPVKPVGGDGSIAIAVDMGNECTKVSYWNTEDGCSNTVCFDENESIPTAIAYKVEAQSQFHV